MEEIDHIVWVVEDLDQGVQLFANLTGVLPNFGGRHLAKGTHNALVQIGPRSYFEILAPDPVNPMPSNRWMGVDLIQQPTVTRWALSTTDIIETSKILHDHDDRLGMSSEGSRQLEDGSALRWTMISPTAEPVVDLTPFYIDWSASSFHPCDHMEQQCSLQSIELGHPEPQSIQALMDRLQIKSTILYKDTAEIKVSLQTPKGIITF